MRGGKQCEADWSSFVLIAMFCWLQMCCAVLWLGCVM